MCDAESGNSNASTKKHQTHWRVFFHLKIVEKFKQFYEQRRAKYKQKTSSDRSATKSANATVAIAILTFILAAIGFAQFIVFREQLEIMSRQLSEMKDGGVDTHNLAEAAKIQASSSIKHVEWLERQITILSEDRRPWIGVIDGAVEPLVVGSGVRSILHYGNFGRTPARYAIESRYKVILRSEWADKK